LFPKAEGTLRHLPLYLSAFGRGRHIPSIAPKFLRQLVPEVNHPPVGVKTKMRAGYFIGCMNDFVFPQTGKHIIDFLTQNGVEVVVPKAQGCCGPCILRAGFDTARNDTNVKALRSDYVICSCATVARQKNMKHLADTSETRSLQIWSQGEGY
jgi:Fe-S oxidoreductase